MKKIIYSSIIVACGASASQATAGNFAIKAYDDITLGKAMSLTTALPGALDKSSSNAFGVGFGYTFWRTGGNSLEANIGLAYRMASAKWNVQPISYSYAAPASADEDGNPYQRYYSLSAMSQKIDLGYLDIPVYLQYEYRATKWLGIHAEVGFGLGFRCSGSLNAVTGVATAYGVYPEYDDLVIDAPYLNDFGKRDLSAATKGKADMKGFSASVMCGAGLEFYVYDPVSLDVGVRYNAGLTDVFAGHYEIVNLREMNALTAPVTYTVAGGQQVKAMSDYVTKSRLNPLSLHIGVNVRF